MMPDGRHPAFLESFRYALQGLASAVRGERNLKVMLGMGAAAVVAGVVLRIDALSWAIVALMIGAVLCAELLNTAIETVVDLVSPQYHPLAKRAKDLAAAAELVLCACVAVGGSVIYVRAALALLGAGA